MGIKLYWEYLKYVMEHKKNVFIECWKEKLYFHAFTHDLSKFSIKEFFPYAKWFYGKYGVKCKENNIYKEKCKNNFEKAWQHHKDKNKHHWNYWYERDLEMPVKHLRQMICDWKAMTRKFGGTAQSYYLKNYKNIKLKKFSRMLLEHLLGLNESMHHNYGNTLEDIIEKQGIEWWNRNCNHFKHMYGVDLLKVLREEVK